MKPITHKIKNAFLTLVRLHNTPQGIAWGVAIGVFIGITPLYGLHTAMVLILAMLITRTNKIAILIGSNISIPPTIPFITWAGYNIGRVMLGKDYPILELATLKNISYKDILHLYYPLFLGSIVLGVICAIVFYFVVLVSITKMRKIRKLHAT